VWCGSDQDKAGTEIAWGHIGDRPEQNWTVVDLTQFLQGLQSTGVATFPALDPSTSPNIAWSRSSRVENVVQHSTVQALVMLPSQFLVLDPPGTVHFFFSLSYHPSISSLRLPLISFSSLHLSPPHLIFLCPCLVFLLVASHLPASHMLSFLPSLYSFRDSLLFVQLFRLLLHFFFLISPCPEPGGGGGVSANHQQGICKISKTNMLISLRRKKCDTLPHLSVASGEPSRLKTTLFQKVCISKMFCAML
jgi:hypothetical protein